MTNSRKVGFLHPGKMGISLAAAAQKSGWTAVWASEGRSEASQARANAHDLEDAGSLQALCQSCEVVISICPPHAARKVAEQVIEAGFAGTFVDANAISPETTRSIGGEVTKHGIRYVDGSVVGPPAWEPNRTRLYLSGPNAETVAGIFAQAPPYVSRLGREIDKASAMKMVYSARTKGTAALNAAILALSDHLGVRDQLEAQWDRDKAGYSEGVHRSMERISAKAWRFAGEMEEIAATFDAAGLPHGFHQAAAEMYRRLAEFKDWGEPPAIQALLDAMNHQGDSDR